MDSNRFAEVILCLIVEVKHTCACEMIALVAGMLEDLCNSARNDSYEQLLCTPERWLLLPLVLQLEYINFLPTLKESVPSKDIQICLIFAKSVLAYALESEVEFLQAVMLSVNYKTVIK